MDELDDAVLEFGVVTLPVDGVTQTELDAAVADVAPNSATYITQTSNGTLTNEQALNALSGPGIALVNADGSISLATGADLPSHNHTNVVYDRQFVIDGGGATITTGIKGDFRIPIASTIVSYYLFADQTGSIQIDLWRDTYANFPPTDADSITASAPPAISSSNKALNSVLTGWTTSLTASDVIRVNVDSCTSIQRVTLVLNLNRTI